MCRAGFVPGFTDNYVSNELIVAGLAAAEVWPFLAIPARWPEYYANAADVEIHDGKGPELALGDSFFFRTFGFPVPARVVECVPPVPGQPARIAWQGAGRARKVGSTCITPG